MSFVPTGNEVRDFVYSEIIQRYKPENSQLNCKYLPTDMPNILLSMMLADSIIKMSPVPLRINFISSFEFNSNSKFSEYDRKYVIEPGQLNYFYDLEFKDFGLDTLLLDLHTLQQYDFEH